jgi:hypothetical protein
LKKDLDMYKLTWAVLVAAGVLTSTVATGAEIAIPRSMADKGKYFLLGKTIKGGIITTLHKRVGVHETGYSETQINCKTQQYRDAGYSEEGPQRIKPVDGKWTDALAGSSKSDLLIFVCSHK